MSIVLQSSGGGSVTVQEPTTASNFTATLPAATGDVALLQTPVFATTIGVGGATPAASGAGITFPSTASASSDANTLDDYEEGTWTPVINGFTAPSGSGWYTKIGRQVFCGFNNIQGVAVVGDNVQANISGMPFAISSYTQGGAISINFNDESDSFKGRLLVGRTTNTQIEFCNRSGVATTVSDPFNMVASYQVL